jgi:UDP-glucose 4-epimerase
LQTFRRLHGLRWTALALANVYGPRQDPAGEAGVISLFADALLAGRPTTVYGDGDQTRDFVHVEDVAAAFVAACADLPVDGRLNIGTGVETTVRELHTLLAALCDAPDTPTTAPARAGELARSALDARRAGEVLGWAPRVPLAEGLAGTVAWIRSRPAVPVPAPVPARQAPGGRH